MKDVDLDRSTLYNSQREVAHEKSGELSPDEKELLMLEERLEKASGQDYLRIEKQIDAVRERIAKKRKK